MNRTQTLQVAVIVSQVALVLIMNLLNYLFGWGWNWGAILALGFVGFWTFNVLVAAAVLQWVKLTAVEVEPAAVTTEDEVS